MWEITNRATALSNPLEFGETANALRLMLEECLVSPLTNNLRCFAALGKSQRQPEYGTEGRSRYIGKTSCLQILKRFNCEQLMLLENFLYKVQAKGLVIDTVYDVGAFNGEWSNSLKSTCLPKANFFLFEANPEYYHILKQTVHTVFCGTVISNSGKDIVEFYNGSNSGDSYYKENTYWYDDKSPIYLPCTTLDKLKFSTGIPSPQFIKLDTQGSELDILQGSFTFINEVDIILVECPIIKYNIGAPSIQDYLDFFKNWEFVPIDILQHHRLEETLVQVDIMFMKRSTKERVLGCNVNVRP